MRRTGFTLIELLIVVAIIAVLAAIAVPNLLEAQVRAKISRVRADHYALATGVECYAVDWKVYPISYQGHIVSGTEHLEKALAVLTTPVAYMSTMRLFDPFGINNVMMPDTSRPLYMYKNYEVLLGSTNGVGNGGIDPQYGPRLEWSWAAMPHYGGRADVTPRLSNRAFILWSPGPDKNDNELYWIDYNVGFNPNAPVHERIYDATNGTVSRGDLGRLGGNFRYKGKMH